MEFIFDIYLKTTFIERCLDLIETTIDAFGKLVYEFEISLENTKNGIKLTPHYNS